MHSSTLTRQRNQDPLRARRDIGAFVYQAQQEGIESPEVWIVNTSTLLIPLEVDLPGMERGVRLPPLPVSQHPHCLTRDIEFETLAKSRMIRSLLRMRYKDPFDPNHPLNGRYMVELRTEEEAAQHYQAIADQRGRGETWEQVWSEISQERNIYGTEMEQHYTEMAGFSPPRSAQELAGLDLARRGITAGAQAGGIYTGAGALSPEQAQALLAEEAEQRRNMGMAAPGQLYVQDPVNPKVAQLCHESSTQVPAGQRMPAQAFLSALANMIHVLTEADFDYLQANGNFREVRAWAGRMRERKFKEGGTQDASTTTTAAAPAPARATLNLPPSPSAPGAGHEPQVNGPGADVLSGFVNAPPMPPAPGATGPQAPIDASILPEP